MNYQQQQVLVSVYLYFHNNNNRDFRRRQWAASMIEEAFEIDTGVRVGEDNERAVA